MKKILDDALQSLGASKGFIMLLSKDGAQKKVSGTPDLILSESLAASEDIELTLMDNPDYILNLKRLRQVVYSNNPSESEWNWSFPPGDYNPKNILIAPILIEDDTVGSIVLIDKKDGFLETDSRIACMIADFSAKTIQQELEMDRLEKSETKYRSLVEQSSNGMALVDGRGIIIEWNQGAEVITGYRPEQICGREAWEVQHAVCTNPPTTSAVFKDLFYRFVDSFNKDDYKAKTTSFQARIKHQDGSIRHVYCTLFPIYTNGEFLTGCIFADETEQIEAEEALFESENRYRTIFETTGTATIIIEEDMTISLANAGFEKLTGKSTNDTENKIQFIEFIIPEEKERLKNYHNIRRINPNLAPPTYETQIMDVEKNVQDVIINVSVIPKTKRTVGSILNITNRKRLERENEERQVYLENLLACAPDAIITLDNHLKIQEWNQGAENLFGYKRDEVKGQNLDRFINRSNVVDKLVALANMNNTCTALPSMETVLYRKDGTPVDVIFAGAPIIVREALVGLVCIFTNISGLKKSAQSLEREAQVNSTMAKVAQKLLTPAYLPELSSMVIKSAIELTGSNTGFTGFIDPENANLIISTITEGQSQDGIKTRQLVFDKETGMWRWTLKHRQPLLSNDPSSIPHGTMFPLGHTPLVRFITAPAFVENTLLGQIAVANSKEDYTQQDLDVIKQLAALYALAIYRHQSERAVATLNTTLEQRVEARTAEMQILYELTQKIGFVRNYEELFSLVLEHLYKVVRYDVAGLVLVDDRSVNYQIKIAKSSTSKLQEEIKANLLSSFRSLSGNEEISDEKSALRIEWIENTTTLPAMDYIENIFKAPLMVGGRIQGMILVGNHDAEAFDADQRRFIATLVHQAGDSVQRLQSLLTQERIRLERLVEHLPEGVLMLDANRRLLIANPTGRSYLKILNDIQIGGVLESLGKTLLDDMLAPDSGETMSEIEFNEMVFEVTGRPFGEIRNEGWVLVIRDVTSERLLQQHIHQQERLAAVGQMAAGIAHDFNNIMAVIVLYTQMLQRSSELGPRSMERLNTINEQAEHATDLIQQILDFSRRSLLKRQPLDLEPFIREQVRIFERTLPESIEIKYTFGVDDYTVNADATRIQQALMNLAVNARDAMINGGELTIQLDRIYIHHPRNAPLPEMSESAGDWIKITVTDNGTGIPPEAVDHIFEPFFTTKEVGKGSGLGLAQVYGIIKQHDGHMEVETDIGQGTSFIIYMPALVDKKQFVIESNDSSIYHGSGETILIVEDNSATRDALVASVESINYRALQAANGKEAIQILEQDSRISMMLTDLVMPEMGGIELLEQLRQCWPHVPVVLLTGYPLGDQFESFANQGICAWLQKPVSLDKLSSTISKVIKQKKDRPTFVA